MQKRPPYENLTVYQLALVNQELTEQFTAKWIESMRRKSQMDEAARSVAQCIAEGHMQESLKGYIYLSGIARGSNVELEKDYRNFLIAGRYSIWPIHDPKIREFRGFRACWISQNTLNTPKLPSSPEEAANMLLTFCNMEGYLIRRLVESLYVKHKTEGGLTEKLYRERTKFRGF